MYSPYRILVNYLKYYFTSSNGKNLGINFPFVFEFTDKVLSDKITYPEYKKVETLRKNLLNNHAVLEIEDYGAGSLHTKSNKRTISSIAKDAAKSKKFGQLLFRIVKFYNPRTVLELGTSLGITTSYLSLAAPHAKIITLEGAKKIVTVAEQNFKIVQLQNVKVVEGNFDNTLSSVIRTLKFVDFAFIDGNHRQEPTERYFHQLLEKTDNNSIFIFDDIHWSSEMEMAWKNIKEHHRVTCSIDLFFIGIVFFRKEFQQKQNFVIRF